MREKNFYLRIAVCIFLAIRNSIRNSIRRVLRLRLEVILLDGLF